MPGIFDEEINKYLTSKGSDPNAVPIFSVNELLNVLASQRREVGVVRGVTSTDDYLDERRRKMR
ncbi:MAG: hypothetical protein ACTSPB_07125 [Candidatus Thorarchaeota archaeon]